MSDSLSILKKILFLGIVLLILAVGAVLLDGLARLIRPPGESDIAFSSDPDYLIELKPNRQKSFQKSPENGSGTINWQTNSLGLRGPEPDPTASKRILVLGDSNVQARFSELADSYCHRIETLLNEGADEKVTVLNGGIIGNGPDQSYLRLVSRFETFKPTHVIFHVFADNDLGDLTRNGLYHRTESGELEKVQQTSDPAWVENYTNPIRRWWSTSIYTRLRYRLLALRPPKPSVQPDIPIEDRLKLCIDQYHDYLDRKPAKSPFYDFYDYDVALDPTGESARAKLDLVSGIFGKLATFCSANQLPVVVVVQPSSRDLSTNLQPNYLELAEYSAEYTQRGLSDQIAEQSKMAGIATLNLFDSLAGQPDPNALFFAGINDHWNNEGQRVASKTTAEFLKELGW